MDGGGLGLAGIDVTKASVGLTATPTAAISDVLGVPTPGR